MAKLNAVVLLFTFVILLTDITTTTVDGQGTNAKPLVKYKHDYFQTYQFENLFSKRNTPIAHAVGFWDYFSFINAASLFEPLGFGTTGNKTTQMMEIAAFLGHVGSKTS
ncbi:chitinase-like protein 2-like, partial [Trifolium pratense]